MHACMHAGAERNAQYKMPPKPHVNGSLSHWARWMRLSFELTSLHAPLLVSGTRDFVVVAAALVVCICVYL
jgi:hypothetical protein